MTSSSNTSETPPAASVVQYVRFSLPEFTPHDPDTWFSAAEHIFQAHKVETEDTKFANVLQYLSGADLSHIKDIIPSTTIKDKYTQAKDRLTQIYGRSRVDEITRLINGTDFAPNMRPSVILAKMKSIAGKDCAKDEIFRSLWIQKLPQRTRELLSINAKLSLEEQAKMADCLFDTYTTTISAVDAVSPIPIHTPNPPNYGNDNAMLMTMITQIQTQISAIQTNQKALEERLSDSRRFRKNHRFRSPSPFRRNTQITNGLCYYHSRFGEKAYKCAVGCKNFKSENGDRGL